VAVSKSRDARSANHQPSPLDPELLNGHTIEQLSDYLDRDRTPLDPSIESSPGAQNALAALSRLRSIAPRILESEADAKDTKDDSWIRRILDQIGVQAHAGREIPISHFVKTARLSISEGAVRALVREVGDELDGIIVERTSLQGDVEAPGEPISVVVDVSLFAGADADALIQTLKAGALAALERHTELNVDGLTVRVRNADLDEEEGPDGG
jgi:hypothetical protein